MKSSEPIRASSYKVRSETSTIQKLKMFINGDWVDSAAQETITSINPANQEPLAEVPRGKGADIDLSVEAARQAFETSEWPEVAPVERGRILLRIAGRIRERQDELARLETLDTGKPLTVEGRRRSGGPVLRVLRWGGGQDPGRNHPDPTRGPRLHTARTVRRYSSYRALELPDPDRDARCCTGSGHG